MVWNPFINVAWSMESHFNLHTEAFLFLFYYFNLWLLLLFQLFLPQEHLLFLDWFWCFSLYYLSSIFLMFISLIYFYCPFLLYFDRTCQSVFYTSYFLLLISFQLLVQILILLWHSGLWHSGLLIMCSWLTGPLFYSILLCFIV